MKKLSEKEAVRLLKKYSTNYKTFRIILAHGRAVKKVAANIGKDVKGIDLDFIKSASLLHDIGRFQYGPNSHEGIKHGVAGADILRKEGLPEYASVAEKHLGAGITKEDIEEQGLELPLKDYVPVSKEEKIIAHADNLVSGYKRIGIDDAVERFSRDVNKKVGKRVKKLADEVERMRKKGHI